MYVPEHFRESDSAAAYAFMMAHPFGLAVTVADGAPFVSHVPFLVDPAGGRIRWHLAAANPQATQLAEPGMATLVFHGPHAYVSPRWYTAPSVPTWNYVAVHVRGPVRGLDHAETAATVAALTRQYEGPEGLGAFESGTAYAQLLRAIRGFELVVESVVAKRKLGQNRSAADQAGVVAALRGSDDSAAREIGALMEANLARHPAG